MKVKELIEKLSELPGDFVVEVTDETCCACASCEAEEIFVYSDDEKVLII